MIDSTPDLVSVLRERQLLTPSQLQELGEKASSLYPEPRTLARELLQRGWLTPFQVNRLLQGQADELFLGPYMLLERIGEGGMGQVFKARHRLMNRLVALKVIRKERLANQGAADRFLREIQVSAQLSHPHIVIAHDAAHAGDVLYFTMEYVDGSDLDKVIKKRGPLPATEACEYIRQAALGLQHAHERGLVHRDIKPHNLLLSKEGQVKILDMGLARLRETQEVAGEGLTHEGALMGTPDYMAPEQALDSHHADIRADIYSLGCTLYHMLAGHPPFAELPLSQKIGAHINAQPRPIEALRSDLPQGISEVLRKMLAKRPQDRYQTPAEVAAVLESIAWRTVAASATLKVPAAVPVKRHEAAATVDLEGWSTPEVTQAPAAIPVAPPAAVPVTLATSESPLSPKTGEWPLGLHKLTRRQMILGGVGAGLAASIPLAFLLRPKTDRESPEGPPPPPRYSWYPPELVKVLGDDRGRHWGAVRTVAYRADGKLIASGGDDARIRIWDSETLREQEPPERGKEPPFAGHTAAIRQVLFTADGENVLSLSQDGTMRLWDLKTGKELRKFAGSESVSRVVLSPDGKSIRGLLHPTTVVSWRIDDSLKEPSIALQGASSNYGPWNISPDGKHVVTVEPTPETITWYQIRLWEADTGKPIGSPLLGPEKPTDYQRMTKAERDKVAVLSVNQIGLARNGLALVLTSDNEVAVWDLTTGKRRITLPRHEQPVQQIALSSSGKVALTYTAQGVVGAWDAVEGKEIGQLNGHKDTVTNFLFSPDATRVTTASADSTLRQWQLPECTELCKRAGHTHLITDVAFSNDGRRVLTGGADRTIRLWQVEDGTELRSFTHNKQQSIQSVAFVPGGERVFSLDASLTNCLWDIAKEKPLYSYSPWSTNDPPTAFCFPRSKPYGYAGTSQGMLHHWDLATGNSISPGISTGRSTVPCVAVAEDGLSLLTVADRVLVLHTELKTGKVYFRKGGHAQTVRAVAFVPGGVHAVSVDEGGILRRWLLREKGQADGEIELQGALPKTITSISFSPNARLVACTGANDFEGMVILWDTTTGQERYRWRMPGPVQRLVFAPDNKYLATANASGTVYIYHLDREGT